MTFRTFRSFAKINLGLEVVGKLPDGYHELKTVFATLSLHDLIEISPRRTGITVACDHPHVPTDSSNLAHRAAALMQQISGRKSGVAIRIQKRIAIGGGLGGGSSNAATVLRALDSIWRLGLGPEGLVDAAKTLGADVPYFLVGGPALGLGRGDRLRSLDIPMPEKVVLVSGSGGVSTAAVFERFAQDRRGFAGTSRIDAWLRSHENQTTRRKVKALSSLRNDLEAAASGICPPLARIARLARRIGRSNGALHIAMSGSGSSFFLLFDETTAARTATETLHDYGVPATRCSFLSKSAYLKRFEFEAPA